MDQLKAHYDKVALIAAAVALLAAAAFAIMDRGGLADRTAVPAPSGPEEPFAPDQVLAKIEESREGLAKAAQWEQANPMDAGSLFVSRVYLLRDGRLVDILEGDEQLFPPIPNSWLVEHNLEYTDSRLLERDTDSDGFTTLEEFMAKTSPADPASKPAAWTKLRLVDSRMEQLRITFMDVPDLQGGEIKRVQINTTNPGDATDVRGLSAFYAIGDPIRLNEIGADGKRVETPTPFKVARGEVRKERNERLGIEEDVLSVVIVNTADGKEIVLEKGKMKDSPYSLATLRDTRDGTEYKLRSGESFKMPDGAAYKLIDVTGEKADIEEVASKEIHSVVGESSATSSQPE